MFEILKNHDNEQIGYIEISMLPNKILIIHEIGIFSQFRKKGYAKTTISNLFIKHNIDTIIGLSTNDSIPFWKHIGAKLSKDSVNDSEDKYFLLKNGGR